MDFESMSPFSNLLGHNIGPWSEQGYAGYPLAEALQAGKVSIYPEYVAIPESKKSCSL